MGRSERRSTAQRRPLPPAEFQHSRVVPDLEFSDHFERRVALGAPECAVPTGVVAADEPPPRRVCEIFSRGVQCVAVEEDGATTWQHAVHALEPSGRRQLDPLRVSAVLAPDY